MQTSLRLRWLLFSAGTAACGAPTSPTCDPLYGRGPVTYYQLECTPSGSDVQCRLYQRETGYCARPHHRLDITDQATWTTSDPTVAAVTAPGRFTTLAAGLVEIHARFAFQNVNEVAFTVAPGIPAERMLTLFVIASDTGGVRVPDVAVGIVPGRGMRQTCQTSATGHCRFWVFQTTIQVTGTKAGYQPAQAFAEQQAGGLSMLANLTMRPL